MSTLRIFFLILVSIFASGFAYANEASCCYSDIMISSPGGCSGDEVELGTIDFEAGETCGTQFPQMYCLNSQNQCLDKVNDKALYDSPIIRNMFESYCSNGFYDTRDCDDQGTSQVDGSGSYTGDGDSDSQTSGGDGDNDLDIPVTPPGDSVINQEFDLDPTCSQTGGLFGFFINEKNCELLDECIYNPELGGYLGNSFMSNGFEYNIFEKNSCISKEAIRRCSDYKTPENCNGNVAYEGQQTKSIELEYGCEWINSSTYNPFSDYSDGSGICVSKFGVDDGYVNKEKYSERLNVIGNPGFESGVAIWEGIEESRIKDGLLSINGEYYYDLSNAQISQRVELFYGEAEFSLYVYNADSFTDKNIDVVIKYYDKTDSLIETIDESFDSSDLGAGDLFNKISFDFTIGNGTKYIVVDILGNGDDIFIDSVSLNRPGSHPLTESLTFIPVEIKPSAASYCELCFEKDRYNFCSKEKSELLGDCSYMVSGSNESYSSSLGSDYSGSIENIYLNESLKWQSQSLANSLLFCEMYTDNNQCTDGNNFVNRNYLDLHPLASDTLCKWDSTIGCYKDSNGDDFPDRLGGYLGYRLKFNDYYNLAIDSYKRESDSGTNVSDFGYGCDVVPPNSYIYFVGKNSSGDEIKTLGDYSGILGDVKMKSEIFDVSKNNLEACNDFNISPKVYFDYDVNGWFGIQSRSYMYSNEDSIVNFFENTSDDFKRSLLNDGDNEISFRILDRSGNVGQIYNFNLDLDTSGPEIELLSPAWYGPFGKGIIFNFSIRDYTSVKSCEFILNKLSGSEKVEYVPYGSFNLAEIEDPSDFTYEFVLPVNETDSNRNYFTLIVSCFDIFDQSSNFVLNEFTLDFNTNLVHTGPETFRNYTINRGFFNDGFEINLISTDKEINDCSYSVDGSIIELEPSISDVSEGFFYQGFTETFYKNISVSVDKAHLSIGENIINVTCTDENGNSETESLNFYFDEVSPQSSSFSLVNSIYNSRNTTYFDGEQYYYSGEFKDASVLLKIDGTMSPIGRIYNFSAGNINDVVKSEIYFDLRSPQGHLIDSDVLETEKLSEEENLEKTFNFSDFNSYMMISDFQEEVVYGGQRDTDDLNLTHMEYFASVEDLAGNRKNVSFDFYYDPNEPEFNFGGDIRKYGNSLFTSKKDPLFEIDFKTPSYRNYLCDVAIRGNDGSYFMTKDINPSSFRFSDIDPVIDITGSARYTLIFNCKDNYGVLPTGEFNLFYDNTPPILKSVRFSESPMYVSNNFNTEISSDLIFEFEETGEQFYECSYEYASYDYNCDTVSEDVIFSSLRGTLGEISDIALIDSYFGDSVAKCGRTLARYDGETKISLKASCTDAAGLKTGELYSDFQVNYVSGAIADFDIEYSSDSARLIAKSFYDNQDIYVSLGSIGEQFKLVDLTKEGMENNVYVYSATVNLNDLNKFPNQGEYLAYAVSSAGDSMQTNLYVDRIPPEVEVSIPAIMNGVVIAEDFVVNLQVDDSSSEYAPSLKKVQLKFNNEIIFEISDIGFDESESMINVESHLSLPTLSNIFDSQNSISFTNPEALSETDNVFTIVAEDVFGNINTEEISFDYIEGFSIIPVDNENIAIAQGNYWYTTQSSPTVKFITTQDSSRCKVYENITSNLAVSEGENIYSYVLVSDLFSQENNEKNLIVECYPTDGSMPSRASFTVKYMNGIADYVLESSAGYTLNEVPYSTQITITNVGPFDSIDCEYELEGSTFDVGEITQSKTFLIDLSQYSGIVNINLMCRDIFGSYGPTKEYNFKIDKSLDLILSDFKLLLGEGEAYIDEENEEIFVNSRSNIGLNFKLNKKNDISCTYTITGNDFVFFEIINFLVNVFVDNSVDIDFLVTPYEYLVSGIGLDPQYDSYELELVCSNPYDEIIKTYDVHYFENLDDIDIGVEIN